MAATAQKTTGWESFWDSKERQRQKYLDESLAQQEELAEESKRQNILTRTAVRLLRPIVLFIVREAHVKATIASEKNQLQEIAYARKQAVQK